MGRAILKLTADESTTRGNLVRVAFFVALAVQPALAVLPPVPWAFVVRPLPLLTLAARVAREVPLLRSWPVILGLVAGGAGDVAMALRQGGTGPALVVGMGLFLIAHVAYAVAFFPERGYQPGRAVWATLFVAIALLALLLFVPHLGALAVPVVVYATALTAMTALAALRRSPRRTVFAGAAVFFVSDALIGARLATPAVPAALLVLVLPLYYLGQYLIATGWARDAAATAELARSSFER